MVAIVKAWPVTTRNSVLNSLGYYAMPVTRHAGEDSSVSQTVSQQLVSEDQGM